MADTMKPEDVARRHDSLASEIEMRICRDKRHGIRVPDNDAKAAHHRAMAAVVLAAERAGLMRAAEVARVRQQLWATRQSEDPTSSGMHREIEAEIIATAIEALATPQPREDEA